MKKLILLFTLLVSVCNACTQTAAQKSGTLLWKISGNDLPKPSYLLGTLHLKSGEYLDSIPGARAALQSCEQVVGEINMPDMAAVQMQAQQAMMMTPDTTYRMLYSDEDYQFVSEKIASFLGVGLDQMGMLKPAAINQTVVLFAYAKYFPGFNPANALDLYIQAEALEEQKPVLGLETSDHQLYVLFGMSSLQQQADDLLCAMKNIEKLLDFAPELINDYNQGDLDKLYQSLEKSNKICPSTAAEMDALNKDRNTAWMQKLPEIMKEKSSFIAVGALHLAGEEGLLNLLKEAGYTVEPAGL
ncbi:MAG: TraB/GumN family protein [Bacteroidales bacterium]|nr:TraB/GumN family protein [Bacteroidales bacterium]MCL2133736.1 TraB/GumN family protein [Bacteroidales bacterium]